MNEDDTQSPAARTAHDAGDQTPRVPPPRVPTSAEVEAKIHQELASTIEGIQEKAQVDAMLQDQGQDQDQDSLRTAPRRPLMARSATAVRTPALEQARTTGAGDVAALAEGSVSAHELESMTQVGQVSELLSDARVGEDPAGAEADAELSDKSPIDELARSPVESIEEDLNEFSTPAVQPSQPTELLPTEPIPLLDPTELFRSEAENPDESSSGGLPSRQRSGAASPLRLAPMARQRMRDLGVGMSREVRLASDVEQEATDEEDDFYKERCE